MKIYAKTFLVLLVLTFSVTAAFAQQEGKTPPKEGKPPVVVKVEKDKNDREEKERQKQEEQKRRDDKKPQ